VFDFGSDFFGSDPGNFGGFGVNSFGPTPGDFESDPFGDFGPITPDQAGSIFDQFVDGSAPADFGGPQDFGDPFGFNDFGPAQDFGFGPGPQEFFGPDTGARPVDGFNPFGGQDGFFDLVNTPDFGNFAAPGQTGAFAPDFGGFFQDLGIPEFQDIKAPDQGFGPGSFGSEGFVGPVGPGDFDPEGGQGFGIDDFVGPSNFTDGSFGFVGPQGAPEGFRNFEGAPAEFGPSGAGNFGGFTPVQGSDFTIEPVQGGFVPDSDLPLAERDFGGFNPDLEGLVEQGRP
jgi:hypothetical protein